MAIVDYEYYAQTYMGEPIAENDFPQFEARAERQIKLATHGRAAEYAALPAFQQEAIKEAICAQVEYINLKGLEVTYAGSSGTGFTVGKVKIEGSKTAGASAGSGSLCVGAIAALEQSGLLNPAVPVIKEGIGFYEGVW